MEDASAVPGPAPDDTAAFQRFYAGDAPAPAPVDHGLLYRLFIGWWRDR
jgi:hypothetical protein